MQAANTCYTITLLSLLKVELIYIEEQRWASSRFDLPPPKHKNVNSDYKNNIQHYKQTVSEVLWTNKKAAKVHSSLILSVSWINWWIFSSQTRREQKVWAHQKHKKKFTHGPSAGWTTSWLVDWCLFSWSGVYGMFCYISWSSLLVLQILQS